MPALGTSSSCGLLRAYVERREVAIGESSGGDPPVGWDSVNVCNNLCKCLCFSILIKRHATLAHVLGLPVREEPGGRRPTRALARPGSAEWARTDSAQGKKREEREEKRKG